MECNFCKRIFSNNGTLKSHKKTAKYCLQIQEKQGIEIEAQFQCEFCHKKLSQNLGLERHYNICKKRLEIIITEKCNDKINQYETTIMEQKEKIKEQKEIIEKLQDKLENIAIRAVSIPFEQENKQKDIKIQHLTKKYVKSRPRVQYEDPYVIYILTTVLMKKDRRYILGKATNLTSRLSVYNKSDEHEVVYYKSCGNVEIMGLVENMVFQQLKKYREQANRERFVLPEKEDIKLFSDIINNSINFFIK